MTAQAEQTHALYELFRPNEEGESVSVKFILLDAQEESFVFTGWVVDAKHPRHDIERQHLNQVLGSFRSRGYKYAW